MSIIREKTEQLLNKKNAQQLYSKYMTLALDTRTKGDRVLFENYYQRAEYYLRLMNELNDDSHLPSDQMVESSPHQRITLPFKGHAMRSNRRNVQTTPSQKLLAKSS